MRLFRSVEVQYFLIIFIVGCFTLSTTTKSLAAGELKSEPSSVMEDAVLVAQPDRYAVANKPFEFILSAGYRQDNLNWNEASANGSVNIMSELKWENLNIAQISAAGRLNFYADWSVRAMLDYGRINFGSNQDSDYGGNNRTLEWSRSNNKGGGEVRDASLSVGKKFLLWNHVEENLLSVTPLAGWSINQQNLTMADGLQTLGAPLGPFPGLNNSYDAEWRGPWLGMDALLESGTKCTLSATAEYHWADYSAQAYWNLRNFSFVHSATGQGIVLMANATYLVSKDWRVGLTMKAQQWRTGTGVDRTVSGGSVNYYLLNEVNWGSRLINLELIHIF